MRRLSIVVVTLALPALAAPADAGPLKVVTTTEDLAAIARAVGGDAVQVRSITKGSQDPHHVDAKPSFMARLRRADLLIYVGLQLEVGWLPLLIDGARNPDIRPGRRGHLDASVGVPVLGRPEGEVDRSQGDVHPEGNPHYWLDPRNGLRIAASVTERLAELAPDRAAELRARGGAFQERLKARIAAWEAKAARLKGLEVVTYHATYAYLARWLGLKVAAQVEERPGIPPSPRHVAALVRQMRRHAVPILVSSGFAPPAVTARVAGKASAKHIVLPASVGGAAGVDSYEALIDHAVGVLLEAAP